MVMIVDVIHPILCLAVPAEWLRILERFPLPIDLQVGWVVLHWLNHSMSQHDLTYVFIIVATNTELNVLVLWNKGLTMSKRGLDEVAIDHCEFTPQVFIHCGDNHQFDELLWERHLEQLNLGVSGNLVPVMMCPLTLFIRQVLLLPRAMCGHLESVLHFI